MTVVNVTAALTALGGSEPVTSGRITVEYLRGKDGGPATRAVGAAVTLPAPIVIAIADGSPVEPVDVPPTDGTCYARIWVECRVPRDAGFLELPAVAIPATGPVDITALEAVDPASFEPVTTVVTAWQLAVGQVTAVQTDVTAKSAQAVEAAADAGTFAGATEFDANRAGQSAFAAGQSAASALGHKNDAKASADAAVAAAATLARDVPGGVPTLDAGGRVPDLRIPDRLAPEVLASSFVAMRASNFRNRQALMPFRQAATARDTAKCVWYALGDSITEGSSATARTDRYVNRTLARLREVRPVAGIGSGGSLGSLPPYWDGTSMGTPYSSLTGTTPGKDTSFGLGRRVANMASGSGPYTFTVVGTSVDVFYTQGPTTGVMGVKIDGGAVINVPTSGASLADGKKWNSGVLTAGSHTVQISQVSGGSVYFGGIYAYDGDETKGFHLLEAGHYGWRSDQWVSGANWKPTIALHQPQLVTINLGTNDYQSNLAPSVFKANLLSLITDFRNNTTVKPSIVLIAMPERADIGSATYRWSDYVDAMWSISETDRGVAVFDVNSWMISRRADTANAYGLYADQVHPSNSGHGLLGEALADWLLQA